MFYYRGEMKRGNWIICKYIRIEMNLNLESFVFYYIHFVWISVFTDTSTLFLNLNNLWAFKFNLYAITISDKSHLNSAELCHFSLISLFELLNFNRELTWQLNSVNWWEKKRNVVSHFSIWKIVNCAKTFRIKYKIFNYCTKADIRIKMVKTALIVLSPEIKEKRVANLIEMLNGFGVSTVF